VLLDQKRTKRMVQIVAILTSLAFGGVILVVMGLIFFGGGGQTQADVLLAEARERVEQEPRSADAWEQLASAFAGTEEFDQAIEAAERSVELEPDNFRRLQTLVSLQVRQNDTEGAIAALQGFTTRNSDNGEAFLQLGQLAEEAGRTPLARLSYQAFLRLEPDDPNADFIQQRLDDL